jgi:UDP-N-acetylmuramoyl-L-alanyl-D-glutamate--2,6-diaminopimelate ligase
VLRPRTTGGTPLAALFPAGLLPGDAERSQVRVSGVALDSRLVQAGDLYVALPGRAHHGAEFAAAAVAAGAAAVLTDPTGSALASVAGSPSIIVPDPRRAMAAVAAEIYRRPAERLTMLAVTGTNGKTTTTYLLAAALGAAGRRAGVVGTIGFFLDGQPLAGARTTITTPESPDLQALLAVLAEHGADSVAMEVSSHALVLGRADAITFDVAAFTNFGRDHLDFHGDEESYFEAKASLFTRERARRCVINVDDPWGRALAARVRAAGDVELATLSLTDAGADHLVESSAATGDGRTVVTARLVDQRVRFTLGLPGEFNVRNALTALAILQAAGADVVAGAAGLADAAVPGRMQRVPLAGPAPIVYVDFAHTPQAVAAALRAASSAGRGRTVAVLGCGGNRDPEKRRPMGEAASQEADIVLVTDDNPRTEDPAEIRAEVLAGAQQAGHRRARLVVDGGDRRAAIRAALQEAGPGDVIAVLGKGHESGQDIGGTVRPFADPAVVAQEWALLIEAIGAESPAADPISPGSAL